MKGGLTVLSFPNLASNGFSYAPIETTRRQRINRLIAEITVKKALTMSEIRKICAYTNVNSARDLAEALAFDNPDKFCIIPKKEDVKTKTEARKLIL